MEIGMAQVEVSRTTNYTGGNNMIICSQEQRAGNYHDTHMDIYNKGTRIIIDTGEAWETNIAQTKYIKSEHNCYIIGTQLSRGIINMTRVQCCDLGRR